MQKRRRQWRWSLIIESKTDGTQRSRRWQFWLMLALSVLGITATLAVGAGLLPL